MGPPVRSSARGKGWRGTALFRTIFFVCVLLGPLQWDSVFGHPQTKSKTTERLRFLVTDSKNNVPIPGATVILVYWQKGATTKAKKEIEGETDTNGLAEFPSVEANKMAVVLQHKGYLSCWRC